MLEINKPPVKTKSRKPRTEKVKRKLTHSCLCGKRYTCYASLYTHIKIKHDGDHAKYLNHNCDLTKMEISAGRPIVHYIPKKTTEEEGSKNQSNQYFLIKIWENQNFNSILMELISEYKSKIIPPNIPRVQKEEQIEIIRALFETEPNDELLAYLEKEINTGRGLFLRCSERFGSKEWKLLLLIDHFRTFLEISTYRLSCEIALNSYYSKKVVYSDELSEMLNKMTMVVFNIDFF